MGDAITTPRNLYEPADSDDAVLGEEPETGAPGLQGDLEKQEEGSILFPEKCALNVQVVDEAALVDSVFIGNGKFSSGQEETKKNMERQEIGGKIEKKPRRKGGKGRKNRDVLNCHSVEKKEKNRFVYSRKEMEALRFLELEDQKKKWVQVYCGLSPLVAQEYDALVNSDNDLHRKHGSVDFDPRPQFHKVAHLGKDHFQVADDHFDNLEGECRDNDDYSDEEFSSIQRPAFLVTGEPDFDSGPPQDGLEYLRRVRWETARVPKVVVAKVAKSKQQSPYMPQIPDIMDCPENLLPLKEWENRFLADFQELRLCLSRLELQENSPKSSINLPADQEGPYQMFESIAFENFDNILSVYYSRESDGSCMPEATDVKVNTQPSRNSSFTSGDLPTLSAILKMEPAARSLMLRRRIASVENMSTLTRNDCLWLFALCAAVDCPLDADTTASIRSLLRKCASLRAAKTELDEEVAILNVLATISGRYFGQSEK